MAEVVFHPAAAVDYRAGLGWYAQRSRQAARGFEREVRRVLVILADHPECYPECEEACRDAILNRYPYSVIYRINPDGSVLVVAVAHASREPGYWLDRS